MITIMLTKHISGDCVLGSESVRMACAHCAGDLVDFHERHTIQYVESLNSDDKSEGPSSDDSEDLEDAEEEDSSDESASEDEDDEGYDSTAKRKRNDSLSSDENSASSDESANNSDISEFGSRPIKKLRIMSTCIICETMFDALHNADGQCQWHSGKCF